MNNLTGVEIAAVAGSDLEACDLALAKAKNGIHIGGRKNPIRWANEVGGFYGNNFVYRFKKYGGKVVGAAKPECGDIGLF